MTRLAIAAFLLSFLVYAGPVALVKDGQAQAVIVLPADRDWDTEARTIQVETHAAGALQAHFRQMSGAEVPIIRDQKLGEIEVVEGRLVPAIEQAPVYLVIGNGRVAEQLGVTPDGLQQGGFRLLVRGNIVVLIGHPVITHPVSDGGGLRQAVVEVLRQLGCHYLWPGETGKIVPELPTIALAEQLVTVNPALAQRRIRPGLLSERTVKGLSALVIGEKDYRAALQRAMATTAGELAEPPPYMASPDLMWEQWHGLGGEVSFSGGHAFGDAWERWGADHPEWFALQADGTRDQSNAGSRERFCVSNPGLIDAIVKDAIKALDEGADSVSLCPNDGGYSSFCMCDQCAALDPEEGPQVELMIFEKVGESKRHTIQHVALTDRYVWFWGEIAKRVVAKHPDALLLVEAYSRFQTPPVNQRLHPNLVVRYVPSTLDGWEGWRKAGASLMYWRPNILWSGARPGMLRNQGQELAETFNRLAADNVVATDIDSLIGHWGTHGFTYYATARLNWEPTLSYDQLLSEYCQAGFGPAAPQVRRYLEEMGKQPLSLELVAHLREQLRLADAQIADRPDLRARVAFLRRGLNYTHLYLELNRLNELAKAKEPYDKERTDKLLALFYLQLRDIAMRHTLVVNAPFIVHFTGHFAKWAPIGGRGYQLPFEQSTAISEAGYSLTGHEDSLEEMIAAFRLDQPLDAMTIEPGDTLLEADEEGNVLDLAE